MDDLKFIPEARLYKGNIRQKDLKLHNSSVIPDRSNPYMYYELPPNYYNYSMKRRPLFSDKDKVPEQRHTDSRHFRKQLTAKREPEVETRMAHLRLSGNKDSGGTKSRNKSRNQIHPETNGSISIVDYPKSSSRTEEELHLGVPRYSNRKPHSDDMIARLAPYKTHSTQKTDSAEKQPPDSSSNETTVFNPLYRQTGDHVRQPLLHVSDPDIVQSFPVVRVKAGEVTGNPLIPVKFPVDYAADPERITSNLDLDYYYEYDDETVTYFYHDKGIPSYNALGSVLMGPSL